MHSSFCLKKARIFSGREDLVQKVVDFPHSIAGRGSQLMVVHGQSGSGKTSLMCKAAYPILLRMRTVRRELYASMQRGLSVSTFVKREKNVVFVCSQMYGVGTQYTI